MINLQNEIVLSLTEAARHLPRRRAGKRPHVATLYRWISRGLRGVKLEAIRVGGTLCTSQEALQRFCERLSAADSEPSQRTTAQRERATAAEAELAAQGI